MAPVVRAIMVGPIILVMPAIMVVMGSSGPSSRSGSMLAAIDWLSAPKSSS